MLQQEHGRDSLEADAKAIGDGLKDLAKAVREAPAAIKKEVGQTVDVADQASKLGYQQGATHFGSGGFFAGVIVGVFLTVKILQEKK